MLKEYRLHLITWNVKGKKPSDDLRNLLGLDTPSIDLGNLPFIYAIGFQEVDAKPTSYLFEEPWIVSLKAVLSRLDYVKVKDVRLQGLLLVVFVKRGELVNIREIETCYTKTGMGGLWGNKGGVTIRFSINGCSICITNSHLAAHQDRLEQRIRDYHTIMEQQIFEHPLTTRITTHDYVFWMGDLNFRLDDIEIPTVLEKIAEAKTVGSEKIARYLLNFDQLRKAMKVGTAFSEFTETPPKFLPTFKFIANTSEYNTEFRKPAYTDRILYRCTENAYENVKLELKQMSYTNHECYMQSDHKPVSSEFSVKIFTQKALYNLSIREPLKIIFDPIVGWQALHDCVAWYTVSSAGRNWSSKLTQWDWIGLFRADFDDISDYVCYVWAHGSPNNYSGPTSPSASSSSSSSSSEENLSLAGLFERETFKPWFKLVFSDLAILLPSVYRLVYISESGDIMGMSDIFVVTI